MEMGGERKNAGVENGEVNGVSEGEEEEEEEEEVGNEPPIAKLPPSLEAVLVQKEVISLESEGALVVALTRDSFLLGLLVLHRLLLPVTPSAAAAVTEEEEQRQEASGRGTWRERPEGDRGEGLGGARRSDGGEEGVAGGGGGRGGRSERVVGAVGRLQQWVLRRPERRGEGERGREGVREEEVGSVEGKGRAGSEGGKRQGQGEGTREQRSGEVGGEGKGGQTNGGQANGEQVGGREVEWVQLKPYEEEEQRAAVGVARSLAFAYVMEQRAWMMQQSLWQRTVTIDSLLDQMRAPLSALRTLGRMLMPQVAKTELGPDLVQGMVSQGDEIGDVLSQLQQALYPLPHPPGAAVTAAAAATEGSVGRGVAQSFPSTTTSTATTATTIPHQSILPPPYPHRTQLLLPPLADTELPMPPLLLPAPPAVPPAATPAANPQALGALSVPLAPPQEARLQTFSSDHPTCSVHRVLLPLLDAATSLAAVCEIRFTVSYGSSIPRAGTEPAAARPVAAVPAAAEPAAAEPEGAAVGRVLSGRENWGEGEEKEEAESGGRRATSLGEELRENADGQGGVTGAVDGDGRLRWSGGSEGREEYESGMDDDDYAAYEAMLERYVVGRGEQEDTSESTQRSGLGRGDYGSGADCGDVVYEAMLERYVVGRGVEGDNSEGGERGRLVVAAEAAERSSGEGEEREQQGHAHEEREEGGEGGEEEEEEESWEVLGHERDIRRLLQGVLDAALHATEGGGWVHVHWQRAPGGGVLLLVEDSGVGVHYLSASMAASTQNLPPGKLARAADALASMEVARGVAEAVGAVMRVLSPHLINAPSGYGGTRVELWLPPAPENNFRVLAVLGVICVALCMAGARAQATPPPKPTKAQLKAELNNMATNITKRYPQYAKYAKDMNRYIGLVLNSKYDFSALADATILLPSDTEAQALAKKLPVTSSNIPIIYNITAYHILPRKQTVPQLNSLKKSQPLATQLKQAIYKVSPQNGNSMSFAKGPNAPAAAWTTIQIARLYAGPYFIAHGVDKILIPAGTTVPK
ncbi:unnamed protein product [Closterium sp. Naga37s-1]|nr:unnamed protein product [Closterium sp. Naga37s-1]